MKHLINSSTFLLRLSLLAILLLSWLAMAVQPARAQEGFDPVEGACLGYYADPVNCTAQDMRIKEVVDITYHRDCDGIVDSDGYDTMDVTFTLLVSTEPTPMRYDIGIFMAKYGNIASEDGVCYRDYLGPEQVITTTPVYGDWNADLVDDIYEQYPIPNATFTGWWDGDGDACGDMDRGTQVFMTDITVTVACSDSPDDADTAADISMCVVWDEQAKPDCNSYMDAGPATPAKCNCDIFNFKYTPTELRQMSLEAKNNPHTSNLLLSAGAVLLAVGVLSGFVLYRKVRVIAK